MGNKIHKIILIIMIVLNLIAPIVYLILYSKDQILFIEAVCMGVIITLSYILILSIISLFEKKYWFIIIPFKKNKKEEKINEPQMEQV